MKSITNTEDADCCVCSQPHRINRRHFIKSMLPGAIALYVLQSAQPARAEKYQAQALVLSCIDFRFLESELSFLAQKNLGNQYDGAYASKIDYNLSEYPERELQVHADYLNRAYWAIRARYPDLNIELYFVTLNNSVKAVFPRSRN